MQTILVPLDGSALAEEVLPCVRMLAPLLGASVQLLGVVSKDAEQQLIAQYAATVGPPSEPAESDWQWEHRALAELTQKARAYLAAQAQALCLAELEVSIEVGSGAPAESIVEVAGRRPDTLIAMATHGYSGLKRWNLGSVADKVLHATTAPILLVRSRETPSLSTQTLRRIVLPLDGSDFARQALPLAIELAIQARAELILLQAIAPMLEVYPHTPTPSRAQEALRGEVQRELDRLADSLRREVALTTPVAIIGHAAEAIVEEAARRQADLIVMATHGYGGLKRWALGSVADKVLHATMTPLLLVPVQPRAPEP